MNIDFEHFYTSFTGRINRSQFWVGICVLLGVYVVVQFVFGLVAGEIVMLLAPPVEFSRALILLLSTVIPLAFAYPVYALLVKRGHDRNRSPITAQIALGLILLVNLLTMFMGFVGMEDVKTWSVRLGVLTTLCAVYLLVDYGILPGVSGVNDYGPAPKKG